MTASEDDHRDRLIHDQAAFMGNRSVESVPGTFDIPGICPEKDASDLRPVPAVMVALAYCLGFSIRMALIWPFVFVLVIPAMTVSAYSGMPFLALSR